MPVGLANGTYAAVNTTGDSSVAPNNDVWYFSNNPSQPVGFGGAGFVPISFGTGFAAVDTSGKNSVGRGNDVWYASANPGQPVAYGAAGWVPVALANGQSAVVNTSGTSGGVTPNSAGASNFAGYGVTPGNGTVTDTRGTWVVPSVTGQPGADSATFVAIDGFQSGSQSVEQAGTVQMVNSSGYPAYAAFTQMLPSPPQILPSQNYPVQPGDTITSEVLYIGGGKFNLSLSDQSSPGNVRWVYNTNQSLPNGQVPARSSAEWVEEQAFNTATQQEYPLANFGSVTFSNIQTTISGGTQPINIGNINDLGNQAYSTYISGSGAVALPSALNSNNNGFTVNFGGSTPAAPTNSPDVPYYIGRRPSSGSTTPTSGSPTYAISSSASGENRSTQESDSAKALVTTVRIRKSVPQGVRRTSFSSKHEHHLG